MDIHLSKRQVGELRRPIDHHPLTMGAAKAGHHLLDPLTHIPVVRERVLHIEIGQSGLFCESLRSQQILDAIARDSGDLNIALAGQTLEIQVGQAKRHAELCRERTLGHAGIPLDFGEQKEISLTLYVQWLNPNRALRS